jgi:hypothetical protein
MAVANFRQNSHIVAIMQQGRKGRFCHKPAPDWTLRSLAVENFCFALEELERTGAVSIIAIT